MKIRVIVISAVFSAVVAAAVPAEARKYAIEIGRELLHRALDATLGAKMKEWVDAARDFVPLEIGDPAFAVDLRQKAVVAVQLKAHGKPGWSQPVTPIRGVYQFIEIESLDGPTPTKWYFGAD